MRLKLIRYSSDSDSSGGLLFIDGKFFCYVCEDEKREFKIHGETRIPNGCYKIKLRNEGGMTKRYAAKYDFHRGMLHLQDVPGFEWVYIHTGNNDDHTEGCLLVGYQAKRIDGENEIHTSRAAYICLYLKILDAIDAGEEIEIEIGELMI